MIDYSGKRSMEEVTRFLHGELVVGPYLSL